ncbi:MAG: hypothetical protein CL916_06235 [Deltaproteobacteria bacterium]|nr:hypothetical protein [Deltaproteobacteria bacterium]
MLLFALVQVAIPCAGLLHGDGEHVESHTQQVIFSLNGDNTVVEYQIRYEGDAEDFGWVIPIFGDLVDIQEGESASFDRYNQGTKPSVFYDYAPTSSCGATEKGDDNSLSGERYVHGFAGQFEYLIIPASQGEEFLLWGQENDWSTDGISSILPQYGSESNISLVMLKIRQDVRSEDISTSPTIKIEYERHEMRYPAMLSKLSMEQEIHTVVYVLGEAQATVGGWGEEEVGNLEGDISDDANDIYRARLLEISESRTSFGIVFSGEIDGTWVTRFDSLLRPEQNTHEPFFRIGNKRETISSNIYLSETSGAWIFGVFMSVFAFIFGRRES